jgi:WD40 repeat protein
MSSGSISAAPLEFLRETKVPEKTQVLNSVAWSPDGRLLAAAGESPSVFVWQSDNLNLVRQLDGGVKGMSGIARHSIAFSPDGKWLAAGCRAVRIWDTATWTQAKELIGPGITIREPQPIGVHSLLFSPDGLSLVVSYDELAPRPSPIVAFSLGDSSIMWTYELHSAVDHPRISSALIPLPNHHEVAFGSGQLNIGGRTDLIRSTAIVLLDANQGTETRRIERIHSEAPAAVAMSRDERLFATASHFGSTSNGIRDTDPVRIWDAVTGTVVHEIPVEAHVWAMAFSSDGRYLVASESTSPAHNQLTIWRVDSWAQVQTLNPPAVGTAWGLGFSPDGRELAAVGPYGIALFRVSADLSRH